MIYTYYKHGNGRYFDLVNNRYVKISHFASLIRSGSPYRVVIKSTAEDLTDDVTLKALLWIKNGSDPKRDYRGKML